MLEEFEKVIQRHNLFESIKEWSTRVINGAPVVDFPDLVLLVGYEGAEDWLEYSILNNPALRSRIAIQMSEGLYDKGIPRNLDKIEPPTRSAVLITLAGQIEDHVCADRLLKAAPPIHEVTADDIVAVAMQLKHSKNQYELAKERLIETGHVRCANSVRAAELVHHMIHDPWPVLVTGEAEQWSFAHNTELPTFMSAPQYRGLRRDIARRVGRKCAQVKGQIRVPPFLNQLSSKYESSRNSGFMHFAIEWILSSLREWDRLGHPVRRVADQWCEVFAETPYAKKVDSFIQSCEPAPRRGVFTSSLRKRS